MTVVATFQITEVRKAWIAEGVLYREGWFSTNSLDRQKDITEPEAFAPVLKSYFDRSAPVSSTHDLKSYPIGHLQRGALLRDGKVFQEQVHPTDPAEFSDLPSTGTGFYARLAVNDPIATHQVSKGNIGGCSFIAYASRMEKLPGGGNRYLEFDELLETTIAAFPVNPQAVLKVAKAFGYNPEKEPTEMTPEQIQAMIDAAILAAKPADAPAVPVVKAEVPASLTPEMLTSALATMSTTILTSVDSKLLEVKKASDFSREGTGRLGQINTPEDARDADPLAYIVKKAESGEALTLEDKDLIAELTLHVLRDGMHSN